LYTDFAKAFDVVSVPKLLYKLENYGIQGLLLACIKSFLINRFQCVRVNSNLFTSLPVISGVPQGSVLGPLLFWLYINDVSNVLASDVFKAKLFADDLKCYNVKVFLLTVVYLFINNWILLFLEQTSEFI